jgi:hypothetical protein
LGDIPGNIFQIFDQFPRQYQQKEEHRMYKNDGFKVLVVHKNRKKRGYCQGSRYKVPKKRNLLEFVGVKPYTENIGRKEKHCPKRNITGRKNGQKIQNEIGGQFKSLAHQAVQHGLSGLVNQILFRIVKIIDNVACGDYENGSDYDYK